jgi:hypothetical protein
MKLCALKLSHPSPCWSLAPLSSGPLPPYPLGTCGIFWDGTTRGANPSQQPMHGVGAGDAAGLFVVVKLKQSRSYEACFVALACAPVQPTTSKTKCM